MVPLCYNNSQRDGCMQIKKWLNEEQVLLRKNKTMIQDNNVEMLTVVLSVCAVIFLALWIMSFFVLEYVQFQGLYALTSLGAFGVLLLHKLILKGKYIRFLIYFSFFMFFLYAYSSSFFFAPAYISVVSLLCQLVLPAIIVDKTTNITWYSLLLYGLYIYGVLQFKIDDLISDEIINMTTFTLVGMTLGYYIRKMKLETYEHRRLAIKREHKDFLTGLYNRKKMFADMEYLVKENQTYCAFFMIDVDHFKVYNDTFGHVSGDACLRELGTCMKQYAIQHHMHIYRFGGEEFAAFLYDDKAGSYEAVAQGLKQAIYNLQIPHASEYGTVSISVGVCPYINHLGFDEVIKYADKALYEAKRKGRNRIELHIEKNGH